MQEFLTALLICSASMSVLMLVFLLVTPLLEKRYTADARYTAWKVFFIGLLIPFRPEFPVSLVTVTVNPAAQVGGTILPGFSEDMVPLAQASGVTLWQAAFLLWFCGAFGFLLFHLLRHLRFMKTADRWEEEPACRELVLLQEEKAVLGIRKRIRLCRCPAVPGPMLTGFWRPRILLPDIGFSEKELRLILRHELIHFKRGDLIVRAAQLLCAAIHWFNPALYLFGRALNGACEASCDARVVRGLDVQMRRLYAETILRAAQGGIHRITAFSINLNGGKNRMKKRLTAVLDTGLKKAGVVLIVFVLLLTVTSGVVMVAAGNPPAVAAEDSDSDAGVLTGQQEVGIPEIDITETDTGILVTPQGMRIDMGSVLSIANSLKPGSQNRACIIYDGIYYRAFVLNEGMAEEKLGVFSEREKAEDACSQYIQLLELMEEYELQANEKQ